MSKIKVAAIEYYLDYVNNFTTVKKLAEYYGLTEEDAESLVTIGRKLHEENVEHFKNFGKLKYEVEDKKIWWAD